MPVGLAAGIKDTFRRFGTRDYTRRGESVFICDCYDFLDGLGALLGA